jgi:hypothetical protein
MIVARRGFNRPALADRAIALTTRLCAALIEAPTCLACRRREAETGWVADAVGGIHGVCSDCAGQ